MITNQSEIPSRSFSVCYFLCIEQNMIYNRSIDNQSGLKLRKKLNIFFLNINPAKTLGVKPFL